MSHAQDLARRSDLPVRVVAGAAMVAVALGALWLRWPFWLLIAAASALMLVEWASMHGIDRRWALAAALLLVANLALAPAFLPMAIPELDQVWFWFASAAILATALGLARRSVALAWGYLYLSIPAFCLIFLLEIGWQVVLWAMLVTWATDIFAYFAGRSLGGPRLAPRISPKKTWAGLAGGIIGAAVVGYLAAAGFALPQAFLWAGGIMAVIAQVGDLYESAVKRRVGVKDSGTLLPGHGGVLDRLDGLLPVAVATLMLSIASI